VRGGGKQERKGLREREKKPCSRYRARQGRSTQEEGKGTHTENPFSPSFYYRKEKKSKKREKALARRGKGVSGLCTPDLMQRKRRGREGELGGGGKKEGGKEEVRSLCNVHRFIHLSYGAKERGGKGLKKRGGKKRAQCCHR